MPSCVLLPFHMLRIYLHFNGFCHAQPKVLSSLSLSLPDPFLSSTSASITEMQAGPAALSHCTAKWLSRIYTQGQQRYAKHKIGPLGHGERHCWWKTSPASPSSSPQLLQSHHTSVWQQTLGTAPGKAECARGKHKRGFCKISAIRACTELFSQNFFQGH